MSHGLPIVTFRIPGAVHWFSERIDRPRPNDMLAGVSFTGLTQSMDK